MQDLHLQGGTRLPVFPVCEIVLDHAGPWRRAAAKPQDGLMGNGGNYLLRRTRLCEADPSPGLWPPPFSKGGRFIGAESLGYNDGRAAVPPLESW